MIIHIGREQMGIQMNVFLINISVASICNNNILLNI